MFPFTNRHRVIDSESTLLADSEKSLLPKKEIRFKDEIPAVSKEDEYVSVLGDEPAKSEQCYFCHGREDLVSCTGGCNRAYHLRCIGMKATTNYANWKCKQCRGMALKSSDYHKKHCLKQWYLKYVVSLQSGEKSIVFEGIRCFDNTVWKCSPVSSVIDPTHFQTVNNAIYILIGEEDAKKSAANGFQQDVCDAFQKGIPQDWKARIGGCGADSELAQQPSDVSIDKEKDVSIDKEKEKDVVVEKEVTEKEGTVEKKEDVVEKEKEQVNKEKTKEEKTEGDKEAPQPVKAPAKRRRRNTTVPSVRVIPLDPEDSDSSAAEPQEPLEPSEFPPPVRRSSRIRMPPLAFWKNEYLRENVKTGRTELIVGSSNADLPSVMAHAFPLEPSPSVYEMVTAATPSVRRSKEKKSGEKKEKRVEKTVKKKPERTEKPEKEKKEKVEKKKPEKKVEKEAKNPVKKPKTKTPPVEKPKAPEPVFVEVRFRSDADR